MVPLNDLFFQTIQHRTFLKGQVTQNELLNLMLFQTHKTFVNLHNTNKDLFDEIWEFLSLHKQLTDSLTLQKVHKEIVKLIYMNWAV